MQRPATQLNRTWKLIHEGGGDGVGIILPFSFSFNDGLSIISLGGYPCTND